jgi:hypothetical protein
MSTQIRAGTTVTLPYQLQDTTKAVPWPLYDPPSAPTLTIIDPAGVVRIAAQAMTKLSQGNYFYLYTTPLTPLGIWRCRVDALDISGNPSGSPTQDAFQLVSP